MIDQVFYNVPIYELKNDVTVYNVPMDTMDTMLPSFPNKRKLDRSQINVFVDKSHSLLLFLEKDKKECLNNMLS